MKSKLFGIGGLFCVLLTAASLLFLSGCTTEYERSDIQKVAQSLVGGRRIEVSKDYQERQEEDSYTDRIWTVRVPETGLEFHIIDDYHWGAESVTNYLWDDYDEAVLGLIQSDLPGFSFLTVDAKEEAGIWTGRICADYQDPQQLRLCFEELNRFHQACDELGYPELSIFYQIAFQHPLRNRTNYVVDDADAFGSTDNIGDPEDTLRNHLLTLLDYRYDAKDTFSPEQIASALEGYYYRVGIYTGAETDFSLYDPNQVRYYDDIIASRLGYGVSFGSLFEILSREGFAPQGNYWHYSFVGADGATYEISYDFCDYPFYLDEGVTNGYYYLRNGEQVAMNYYFYNHFNRLELEQMTGLKIVGHLISE